MRLGLVVGMVLVTLGFGLGSDASAKPKIAVLGLEVQSSSGQALDAATPVVAKELTDQLRNRARTGTTYDLANQSDKELVDEKLINTCDSELPGCMAPIGAAIGANYLLYGHIKKEGGNYLVDLQLLNVNTKAKERSKKLEPLPVADATDPAKLQAFAKKWYAFMTGENTNGRVVITVSNKDAERGTVFLNDKEKGFLSSGRVEIDKVGPGNYKLAIEVSGFQRFEKDITVVAGDTLDVPATLVLSDGTSTDFRHQKFGTIGDPERTNYWRPVFVTGGVLALAGASFWIYSYIRLGQEEGKILSYVRDPNTGAERFANKDDCNGTGVRPGIEYTNPAQEASSAEALRQACKIRLKYIGGGVAATAIGGVIMLGTFYYAWLRDNGQESSSKSGRARAKKPSIAFTPIISPDGGGATLRIDW